MADPINKDYGRRHYLSDREYQEQMRETTDFAVDSRIKMPHSEFKKPWAEDEYPQMEYGWDPPGFTPPGLPPWPDIPHGTDPNLPGTDPGDPFEPSGPGLGCLFYWPLTPGLLDPGETAYAKLARRDDPIVSVKVEGPATLVSNPSTLGLCTSAGQAQANSLFGHGNPGSAECTVIIKVNAELTEEQQAETILFIDVTATTRSGATCSTSAIVNQENCVDADAVTYDDINSPETISRNESKLVYITDGVPPFTWAVSGTGFTISPSTTGRYNLLRAGATACGTAQITVTDSCGDQTTGEVRCLDSSGWVDYGEVCLLPGHDATGWNWIATPGTSRVSLRNTITYGGIKQYESLSGEFTWVDCLGNGGYFDTEAELDACKVTKCLQSAQMCMDLDPSHFYPTYPNTGTYTWCGGTRYYAPNEYVGAVDKWHARSVSINGFGDPNNLSDWQAWRWECN